MLLTFADAQTPTGVVAAVYMGMAGGATHLIALARAAIAHERERCAFDGRYGGRGCLDDAMKNAS